jgi:hypothetical protein
LGNVLTEKDIKNCPNQKKCKADSNKNINEAEIGFVKQEYRKLEKNDYDGKCCIC